MALGLLAFSLFILGINIGSFLNVLIDRLPQGEQVFKGRSYCDHCHHKLSWRDLFPLFSWMVFRGKCRYCHSPISVQYPLVELSTGLLFVLTLILLPLENLQLLIIDFKSVITLFYYLFVVSTLIVIFVADLKYMIIPDQVIFPAIITSFIFLFFQYPHITFSPIFFAFLSSAFFLIIVLVTRGQGMGWGDVKLALLMGLFLGFPRVVVAFYLAFLTGATLGVILVFRGQKKFGQQIPFGPFLSGSTIFALFWGNSLWLFMEKFLGIY